MANTNAITAQLLETSVAGFAAAADARFRARLTESGSAAVPYDSIRSHLSQRILELAAAVRLQDASVFTQRVDWLRRAYQARGADETTLKLSIESLRDALLEELPENLGAPVAATIDPAVASFAHACAAGRSVVVADTQAGRLGLSYLHSCLEGKPRDALQLLLDALRDGVTVDRLLTEVLAPAQQEAGELWHSGEITIAEEHLISETTREALAILVAREAPADWNGRRVLAAAVAGNAHDIGLRVVNGLFRLAGWDSIFLGADVPVQEIAVATHTYGADVVLLNATLTTHLKLLQQTIDAIRRVTAHPAVLIGGRALDDTGELWRKFGADGFARDAAHALELATELTAR